MKVIHICGTSGSGKTTLIRRLIPLLAEMGDVAVVKHLGHHSFELPKGKDTTFYSESGATISAGIDPKKTVFISDTVSLGTVLDFLSFFGMSFTIVEGFKSLPMPKVVMGTLSTAHNVILENPSPQEILDSLDRFPDYLSYCDMTRDILAQGLLAVTGSLTADSTLLPPKERREFYDRFFPMINEMLREGPKVALSAMIRVHLHQGLYFGSEDRLMFAVGSPTPEGIQSAVSWTLGRIEYMLRTALNTQRR